MPVRQRVAQDGGGGGGQPPPEPGRPADDANPYVKAVLERLQQPNGIVPDAEDDGGRLRRLVGFLGAADGAGLRTLYDNDLLDCGVEVNNADIVFYQALPPDEKDGLARDAIWVKPGADLTYWSKRPPRGRNPQGGNGYPDPFPGI